MDIVTIDGIDYQYDYEKDKLIKVTDTLITNINKEKTINDLWYPDKPDVDLWESFLGRSLSIKEKKIILSVFEEKDLNNSIKGLQQNLLGSNCFIKELTNNNGNCLFESLGMLGLGDNELEINPQQMLRNNLSSILLYMRNIYDFFPALTITPEEIFNNSNEIDFVKNDKTGEVYEYNYDMMVCDLRTNYSWERLPTELILMTVSRLYEVKILIYHNKTQFVNEINVWKGIKSDDELDIIRLGHINEEHYVPVLRLPEELIDDIETIHQISKIKLKYDTKKINYKQWAEKTANEHYSQIFSQSESINDCIIESATQSISQSISNSINKSTNQVPPTNIETKLSISEEPEEIIDLRDFEII